MAARDAARGTRARASVWRAPRAPWTGVLAAGARSSSSRILGRRDAGIAQNPGHRATRLVQRRQQQMFGADLRARLPCLLRRGLDQPLGVRRVGGLLRAPAAAAARTAAATAGLEPLAHFVGLEADAPHQRLAAGARAQQGEQDVLRADGAVAQADGFLARPRERLLGGGAQRMRLDSGCGVGAQSGLASSMSMMGMPSSTA